MLESLKVGLSTDARLNRNYAYNESGDVTALTADTIIHRCTCDGLAPFTSSAKPEPPARFHPFMRIAQLVAVAPGTPDEMVLAVYSAGKVAGGHAGNICLSKLWPGSIRAVEIAPITEFRGCWARGDESE